MQNPINYFLSTWIANFGVVPLFLSMFFLLRPAFFNLFLLLVLVCVVFEDILVPLFSLFNKFYRTIFLTLNVFLVKSFLCFLTLSPEIMAAEQQKDHFISKGEQLSLEVPQMSHYSIGNKEVINHKYSPSKKQILIKASKIGFSDLVIWLNKKKVATHRFFVSSKIQQLKSLTYSDMTKGTNLNAKFRGNLFLIQGELKTKYDLKILKRLQEDKNQKNIIEVQWNQTFKNKLISEIYNRFYQVGGQKINCEIIDSKLRCLYKTHLDLSYKFDSFQELGIDFKSFDLINSETNYRIKLKIVSIEKTEGLSNSSGFNSIQASLDKLISENKLSLNSGQIKLNKGEYTVEQLAEPEILTVLNESFKMELGSEVPFRSLSQSNNDSQQRSELSWKFIGLRVSGKLKIKNNKLKLDYKTQLTDSANSEAISGPKSKSSLYIKPGENIKIFESKIKINSHLEDSIPLVGDIPILRKLFMSEERNTVNKKIIAYLIMEKL